MKLRVIVTGSSVTVIVALELSVTVHVSAGGVMVTVFVLCGGGHRVGCECSSDVVDGEEVVEGGGGNSDVLLVLVMIGGNIVVYVVKLVLQSHALSYANHVFHSVNTPLSPISLRTCICSDASSSVPHTKEAAISNGIATRFIFMVAKFNEFNLQ